MYASPDSTSYGCKNEFSQKSAGRTELQREKVKKGAAECIGANGYLQEVGYLNFYQKLEGLENRNALNDRATTKTLHVSLNFDPSERLSNETLIQITTLYMERIGFGEQPYLVYGIMTPIIRTCIS
jgi:hypothetical protein